MIDDLEIIRLITSQTVEINKLICSPFRNDSKAGARFKYQNNVLKFFDSSDSLRHGKSALQLLMIEKSLTFEEAIKYLKNLNFNKSLPQNKYSIETKPKNVDSKIEYKIIKKNWDKGKEYWAKYGVTDFANMFEVKEVIISTDTYIKKVDKTKELTVCYLFDSGEWKLYTPYAIDISNKWLGSVKKYNCWWYECGSDTLLTLKCSKCFKVVESIVKEEQWSINLNHIQGENIGKTKALIPNYTKIKKYKRHIIVFDPDSTGILYAEVCRKEIGSETPFVEVAKDISDMYLLKGREFTKEWLRMILFGNKDEQNGFQPKKV